MRDYIETILAIIGFILVISFVLVLCRFMYPPIDWLYGLWSNYWKPMKILLPVLSFCILFGVIFAVSFIAMKLSKYGDCWWAFPALICIFITITLIGGISILLIICRWCELMDKKP